MINDRDAATKLMNDQIQLALAIGGPLLLMLIGLAPWAVKVLYSADFLPAIELIQWQTVGNVFKLASWALDFAFVAAARGKIFLLIQVNFSLLFLLMMWIGLGPFGLSVAGPAFLIAYFLHFSLVTLLARTLQGFRWQRLSLLLLALHLTLASVLLLGARMAPEPAAIASVFLSLGTGLFGLRVVLIKIGPEGRIAQRLAGLYAAIGWPIHGRGK